MVVATIKRRAILDGFTVTPKESSPFFVPNYLLDTYPDLVFYDGDEINEEGLIFLNSLSRIYLCRKKSTELLSYREHSSFELTNKLRKRDFTKFEIDAVLALLIEKNYLNDRRFTEVFILSRLRKKAEGKPMILKRLMQKGISYALSDEVYGEVVDHDLEMEILQRAFEKQNRKYGNNNEKFINSMLRLGFNYTQIKNIIKAKEYTNFNKL